MFLRNISKLLQDYTAPHPRRQSSLVLFVSWQSTVHCEDSINLINDTGHLHGARHHILHYVVYTNCLLVSTEKHNSGDNKKGNVLI
jgi:hypothetical protein